MATKLNSPAAFANAMAGLRFRLQNAHLEVSGSTVTGAVVRHTVQQRGRLEDARLMVLDSGPASTTTGTPTRVVLRKIPVGSATSQTLVTMNVYGGTANDRFLQRGVPSSSTSLAAMVCDPGDILLLRLTARHSGATTSNYGPVHADVELYQEFD